MKRLKCESVAKQYRLVLAQSHCKPHIVGLVA